MLNLNINFKIKTKQSIQFFLITFFLQIITFFPAYSLDSTNVTQVQEQTQAHAQVQAHTAPNETKVDDYTIASKIKNGNKEISLNGAGIRVKFFMDIYVGALYTKEKMSDAQKIIESDSLMAIRIKVLSDKLTSEKINDACDEGMEKAAKDKLTSFKQQIDQFHLIFKDQVKKEDIFDLVYNPESGLMGYKNGKLIQTIPGKEFKKIIFSIWLGADPVNESLKNKMLGL